MLKQKVVCVKQCNYPFNRLDYNFNIGDQLKLSIIQPKSPDYLLSIVIDDVNIFVLKSDFVTIEKWREQQLNQLGI
jgi:hypothetical protein